MLRLTIISLCSLLLFAACEKVEKESFTAEQIQGIHLKKDSVPQDSLYILLKSIQKEIDTRKELPDSLSLKNNYYLGNYFRAEGYLDSASVYYQRAVDLVEDPLDYSKGYYYFFSANDAYFAQGKYGDCITIAENYLSRLQETDFAEKSLAYLMLSNSYKEIPDLDKALYYTDQWIRVLNITKDTNSIYTALFAKARILYDRDENPKATLKLLDSLLDYDDRMSNDIKRQFYTTLGVHHYYDNNFEKAYENYQKSLQAAKLLEDSADKNSLLATPVANLVEVSIDLKKYEQAQKYLDTITSIGIHNIPRYLRRSVLKYQLRLASATNNNLNLLYDHLDTISKYQELTYQEKINNELVALQQANENEKILLQQKQAAEIENLKLETRSLIGLISAGLLGVIGLLFYQRRKLRFERQSMQNQQRLLRSQMNPHFTFNTLYAIQSEIQKDEQGASDYLLKFSRLLRLTLENSTRNYVLLENELEALREYMDLQKVRLNNGFDYTFEFLNMEEDEFIFVPPMLLQPFVENSIEHGFAGIDYPGKINIQLQSKEKFIQCTIEDNGKGLQGNRSEEKESTSMGLISDFLLKSTGRSVQIIDKKERNANESGILVAFSIPYKQTEND